MAQPQGQPPRHVGAPIQPPPQANPQVLVGELVAGPLNQPLFGQLRMVPDFRKLLSNERS